MKNTNATVAVLLKCAMTLCVCACLCICAGCSPVIIGVKPLLIKKVKMEKKDLELLKNGKQSNPATPHCGNNGIMGDNLPPLELDLPPLPEIEDGELMTPECNGYTCKMMIL